MDADTAARQRRERLRFLLAERSARPVRQRLGDVLESACPGGWELVTPPESEPVCGVVVDRLRAARRRDGVRVSGNLDRAGLRAGLDRWLGERGERMLTVLPSDDERVGALRLPVAALRGCVLALLDVDRDSLFVAETDGGSGLLAQRFEGVGDAVDYELARW